MRTYDGGNRGTKRMRNPKNAGGKEGVNKLMYRVATEDVPRKKERGRDPTPQFASSVGEIGKI